ncbi:YfiR family protein [bacterium M00.F.Ca.ET.228.01.1.1]|uniref:YfiR family protein n=1 Tax=Paraburkholderia phenoliruptrix TaxID=252970 RepID=UPI0010919588|nr:YfiR family protein [Paraburkholderia phenoliruptrix]TGP45934.1 YfiR family protein [bacterium M00.F.Ca.ET.228.01.1.1]TGS04153.1 YfiR family protein [bacterium M00.F.Ca.ET.191.01.1.1]TGU07227.1 YfiR family protein [bacterium M00.F.Ca.ET.155.01.1.1]MBW0446460.1 YfiR family protein [Paraburkholderia phenoliruptrix]MBW9097114.1 YfiR family protein [Paraburkholderia phenoliruptrix]
MERVRIRIIAAYVLFASPLIVHTSVDAQVDLPALEAAYIFNFAQFADWPAGRPADNILSVCTDPESPLGQALARLDGKRGGKQAWRVRPLPRAEKAADCQLAVLTAGTAVSSAIKALLASDAPVVIVSEADAIDHGWVIRLVREGDHLKFDINVTEASRRRITLSSKLMRLARTVL